MASAKLKNERLIEYEAFVLYSALANKTGPWATLDLAVELEVKHISPFWVATYVHAASSTGLLGSKGYSPQALSHLGSTCLLGSKGYSPQDLHTLVYGCALLVCRSTTT